MRGDGMASPFLLPSFLLQMQAPMHEEEEELLHIPPSSSVDQDFHGLTALLGKRSGSFPGINAEPCEEEDLYSDDCSLAGGGKKRRLSVEQVRTLDRNFEMGNRLEPERKMQLARALGLQPRQIAIWFQNRRARWKTKQLEKDYDDLKRQLVSIKEDNDAIHSHNKELEAEITALIRAREASEPINLNKETDIGSCSNRSDNSTEYVNLQQDHMSRTPAADHDEVPMAGTHHRGFRSFFQPAVRPTAAAAADQLLQYPSLGPEPHRSKLVENSHGVVAQVDESFCNMFPAIDDQPGFCWAWTSSEKQSFH